MSSFCRLLIASLINPSLLINSVYIKSAPVSLQIARKGGSLTSSIGASSSGKFGRVMLSIFTKGKTFVYRGLIFGGQKYIHPLSMTYNKDLKGISFIKGFFLLIVFALTGLLLGTLLSIPVWIAMTGKNVLDIANEMK